MCNITDKTQRYLLFDESGNLGANGRYFVISCVDVFDCKSLFNIMKRKIRQARVLFPQLGSLHVNEIKAKDAYPAVKYHIAECIVAKPVTISYIVADLYHVESRLLIDKNIFYNYLMKLLVCDIISFADTGRTINIMYDMHSTKVGSVNSLEEYIKASLIYEKGYNLKLNFKSYDSDASNAYHIQAADYVANAIYTKYEYGVEDYYRVLAPNLNKVQRFPYRLFGK